MGVVSEAHWVGWGGHKTNYHGGQTIRRATAAMAGSRQKGEPKHGSKWSWNAGKGDGREATTRSC